MADSDEELRFNSREAAVLREVIGFLNQRYAMENFIRYGNQPPPDFNKGRLAPEEEKAFWQKLGLGE